MRIAEFKLERYLARHEFSAPYLLCTSDCESYSIRDLLDLRPEYAESFNNLRLGYTESQGNPDLRREIAGLYSNRLPEEIIVTAGAEEGIFISMNILLDAGDHVIIQTPAYQSLCEIPRTIGCKVSSWDLDCSSGEWKADFDRLLSLITPKTRLIVLNSPHNPTGYHFSQDAWQRLASISHDTGIRILSDEVYRGMEDDIHGRLSAMADIAPGAISIGVMSKSFGLAGLRIGWIATDDPEFLRRFLAFKDYTTICSSAPSEFLSILALQNRETIFDRNRQIAGKNRARLEKFFERWRDTFTWIAPVAGTTAFPRLVSDESIETFCDRVREGSGVLLLPGTVFDWNEPHFRVGYGREDMTVSLEKLEEFLE